MRDTFNDKPCPESALLPLQENELALVSGGASIYVDGIYRGEGNFEYWPWPGGRSSTGAPVVFR